MKKTKFIDFVEKIEKFKLPTRILMLSIILIALSTVIYVISYLSNYITLGEINNKQYLEVLSNDLFINISIFSITLLVSFIFILINNIVAIRIIRKMAKKEKKEVKKIPNKSLALLFSIITAFLATEILSNSLGEFLNTTNFLVKDPIFNKDISYYIMQRPFISYSIKFISSYLIATILYLIGYYTACFGYYFDGVDKKTRKESKWLKHILTIGCIYLTVNIIDTFFYKESILYTTLNISQKSLFPKLVGSGFTDVNIKLIYFNILPFILISFILAGIIILKSKKYKQLIYIPIAYLVYTVGAYLIIGVVQTLYVSLNELMLEKKYIQYHLDYTKKAYGIDLKKENIYLKKQITEQDLKTYENTLENINILKKRSYIESLNQDKEAYYKYVDIDTIVKTLNGTQKLLYITAQEMASEKLEKSEYINRNIKYVYGDGVYAYTPDVLEGNLKDVTEEVVQKGQKIYYAETIEEDAIVNPSAIYQDQLDNINVEKNYTGANGLSMNKLNRLNIALKNLNFNAILSKYIDENSKYLITRNITERVSLVLSSMLVDKNPYILLDNNGKAYYVVDVYTVAQDYPYSKSISIDETKFEFKNPKVDLSRVNYIRNSIKVIVDPYDGTLRIYNTDKKDPIAISYAKKYPNLFNNLSDELYLDLEEDFRYPKALMDIQVEVLKQYYIDYAETFYKNENILKLPTYIDTDNNKVDIKSDYSFAKLQNKKEGLALLQPIAYSSEDLAGYFAGTFENGKNKLCMYSFESQSKVLGMIQLDQQIQTSNKMLKETLENIKSNRNDILKKVMLIPLDDKLLYMQIYYSSAVDFASIPKIEKVVISDGKKICVENTINNALRKIIISGEIETEDFLSDEISVNIEQVIKTYKYMKDTLKQGDFEMFGREMQSLDEEILKLEEKYNMQLENTEKVKEE